MPKILNQSGVSLADIYDIEGSIVGIDELNTQDGVALTHEMGQVVFSERIEGKLLVNNTGAVAASTLMVVQISGINSNVPVRIIGVSVKTNVTARIDHISLNLGNRGLTPAANDESPIWTWDANSGGTEETVEQPDGAGGQDPVIMLVPGKPPFLPSMLVRRRPLATRLGALWLRGRTTAFGAGTVTATVSILTLTGTFGRSSGTKSEGLPVPGW